MDLSKLPRIIDGGKWNTGHVQGIAVDVARGYVYYSFTTVLVKTDLAGHLIGSVGGLVGHLGCIDFNPEDGRVYGSLEFKNDSIGKGILKHAGMAEKTVEDAFYVAVFDVDRLTAPDMNAERDGIMTAVYLPDVVANYHGVAANGKDHVWGCSGIDGLSFGPVFGAPADSPRMLMVCCGVYGDTERTDNDYQVLLELDWRKFGALARPLTQEAPHHSGIVASHTYFFYTGNTVYGVQNLCYDPATQNWLVSVYPGAKPDFPNYALFLIDGTKAPVEESLRGCDGARGLTLSMAKGGLSDEKTGISGFRFRWGATGIHALGNGYFYFSHEGRTPEPERLHTCRIHLYRYTGEGNDGFVEVE